MKQEGGSENRDLPQSSKVNENLAILRIVLIMLRDHEQSHSDQLMNHGEATQGSDERDVCLKISASLSKQKVKLVSTDTNDGQQPQE